LTTGCEGYSLLYILELRSSRKSLLWVTLVETSEISELSMLKSSAIQVNQVYE